MLGWIGGERRLSVETGTFWEITGLVVDAQSRRQGVASALVRSVETWALSQGAESLRVRSNVIRDASHRFYEGIGYARMKTQHTYTKRVAHE